MVVVVRYGIGALVWSTVVVLLGCGSSAGGDCKLDKDCSSSLVCHQGKCRDPNAFCRQGEVRAARCARDGLCTLRGDKCVAATQSDCQQADRCKRYHHCKLAAGCCSRDGVCRSESDDPLTYVYQLGDASKRGAALAALQRLFDSTLAQDGGDRQGPHASVLIADMSAPLAKLLDSADLPGALRTQTLQLLARGRHPDGARALVGVLQRYRIDDDMVTAHDAAVGAAVEAIAHLRPPGASAHVYRIFSSLRASSRTAQVKGFAHSVRHAMVALADPGWEPKLLEMLDRPMAPHGDLKRWRDELYWQATAAGVLGAIKSPGAVEPLMKVMLAPAREDVQPAAMAALVRIGLPAAKLAMSLLEQPPAGLLAYAAQQQRLAAAQEIASAAGRSADDLRLSAAALVLANIGRADAIEAVLKTLAKLSPRGRALVALALPALPPDDELLAAFKKVFESSPADLSVSPQHYGVSALTAATPRFFEPSLVPWIVERAVSLPGSDTANAPFREPAMAAAMQLMTLQQVAEVDKLAALLTPEKYQRDYRLAKKLLAECGSKVACYLAAATGKPSPSGSDTFRMIKAATMACELAKPADRKALANAIAKAHLVEVRQLLAQGVVRRSPEGDGALAKAIEDAAARTGTTGDRTIAAAAARLRARVE